jgi:hypothetical protein
MHDHHDHVRGYPADDYVHVHVHHAHDHVT